MWYENYQIIQYANGEREKQKEVIDDYKKKLDVKRVNAQYIVNAYIKLLVPSIGIGFFLTLVYSYYIKQSDVLEYNKGIIEDNTSSFMASINDVYSKINDLDTKIKNPLTRIGDLSEFKDDDKFELFSLIKDMLSKFEKCNYIIEAAKNKLPFPYAEISSDIFMIVIIIIAIIYITTSFNPGTNFSKMFRYKKTRNEISSGEVIPDKAIESELKQDETCNSNEVDDIIFTLKIIFFTVVIIFLIFYSTKVMASTTEFQAGIYNSSYFDNNRCYGQ
jgi:hypothetical protein